MTYVVHINHAKLQVITMAGASRYVAKVLDTIHDVAVRGARGGPYSKGTLAASIYKEGPQVIGYLARGEVGSRLSYADIVERGARPHNIFPRGSSHMFRFGDRKRPQLKFVWKGRIVFTPHVPMSPGRIGLSHPGQTGKHFLLKAAVQASVRYRLQLRIYDF